MKAVIRKNELGLGGLLGAIVALAGTVACGESASGESCQASRTCSAVSGEDNGHAGDGSEAGGSANGGSANGGSANGGSANDDAPIGGMSSADAPIGGTPNPDISGGGASDDGNGGQGGSEPLPGCTGPQDCDNGDPSDGQELCGDDGACAAGNAPPQVVAVSPQGEATAVEPDSKIVVTFSEPLDSATVTAASIRVYDGDNAVAGKLSNAGSKVTFTPAAPLALLAEYTLEVGTGVTDAEGAALLQKYSSTFVTRDGAWHTSNVATGALYQLADTVPITATGDVLVAWIAVDSPGYYCPTSAQWFNRGTALSSAPTLLTSKTIQDCRSVAAGANAGGVASVVWQENAEYAEQYRDGAWSKAKPKISSFGSTWGYAVGVSPSGTVSVFQQSSLGTNVLVTDAKFAWPKDASNIAATHSGLSPAHIAFDSKGNGFAVWRAKNSAGKEEILASGYAPASGWGAAKALPGSLASAAGETSERGVPAIAMDEEGGAMALWVMEESSQPLVTSRFYAGAWNKPVSVAGTMAVTSLANAPGLVFDGHDYVAAWTGGAEDDRSVYSARYELTLEAWAAAEPRTSGAVLDRMPALAVDSHQNLLLTFVAPNAEGGRLYYVRYDAHAGAWSEDVAVLGGVVKDLSIETAGATPLSVAGNGLAAQVWGDKNASNVLATIRLSSFH